MANTNDLNWKELTPKQWLLIDLANNFGYDKELWKIRLEGGRKLLASLQELGLNEFIDTYAPKAEEPEMFSACAIAVQDTLDGKPTGYVMELDAVNSGAQLQSLMTRCKSGMLATGTLDSGERPDLYNKINEKMGLGLLRKVIKKAVVPHLYNSTAAPKNILGEANYELFVEACWKIMPGAEWTKHTLNNCWNPNALYHEFLSPNCSTIHLKNIATKMTRGSFLDHTYDYMHSIVASSKDAEVSDASLPPNVIHSVDAYVLSEVDARCNYNPEKVDRAIRAIEHHLSNGSSYTNDNLVIMSDCACRWNLVSVYAIEFIEHNSLHGCNEEYLLRLKEELEAMLMYLPFETRTVHDGFAASPKNIPILKQVYNDICADLYQSTYLFDTIEDLCGESYHHLLEPVDPEVVQEIRDNAFGLC